MCLNYFQILSTSVQIRSTCIKDMVYRSILLSAQPGRLVGFFLQRIEHQLMPTPREIHNDKPYKLLFIALAEQLHRKNGTFPRYIGSCVAVPLRFAPQVIVIHPPAS